MIYTSYYKNIDKGIGKKISISLYPPQTIMFDYEFYELAPRPHIFHGYKQGKYTIEDYWILYTKYLDSRHKLLENLVRRGNEIDFTLYCYEKDGTNCHRRMLAKYLEEHFNIKVQEI